jgi:hypothetical protein
MWISRNYYSILEYMTYNVKVRYGGFFMSLGVRLFDNLNTGSSIKFNSRRDSHSTRSNLLQDSKAFTSSHWKT